MTHEHVLERMATLHRYRSRLDALLLRPSIAQRTPAWHEARAQLVTASDVAQALGHGKFGTQKQFFWKKCGTPDPEAFAALANCPPIKWGTMYEDVAQKLYSRRHNVRIHEFGLLRHPTVPHLGASPDGISEHGVMLEIKCPYRRKITGSVPVQYYHQIQAQLEVCDLDECDFLEVGLVEHARDAFYDDVIDSATERGIVAEFLDSATSTYAYSGVADSAERLRAFEAEHSVDAASPRRVRMHYWSVGTWSVVRVERDARFVHEMLDALADVWATVLTYRGDPERMLADLGPEPPPKPAFGTAQALDAFQSYSFRSETPSAHAYAFRA